MTNPERVLQPRGSLDGGERGPAQRTVGQAAAADGTELRADDAAGRKRRGVRRDPAVHAGEPEQPDRLDRRPQRRPTLRRRWSPTTFPRTSSSTGRCRSRRASIRTRSCRASFRSGTSRARASCAAALLVIPIGRGLLYAEPIYLQAERSPMPELRLVVLALQDRARHTARRSKPRMAALFGQSPPVLQAPATTEAGAQTSREFAAARPPRPQGPTLSSGTPRATSPSTSA